MFQARTAEIVIKMSDFDKLEDMKECATDFEEFIVERGPEVDKKDLIKISMKSILTSRSALDYSLGPLKKAETTGRKANAVFPYIQQTEEELSQKFEAMDLEVIPEVIKFVLGKIKQPWVRRMMNFRNQKTHTAPVSDEMLEMDVENIIEMTRDTYLMAADVYGFIQENTDKKTDVSFCESTTENNAISTQNIESSNQLSQESKIFNRKKNKDAKKEQKSARKAKSEAKRFFSIARIVFYAVIACLILSGIGFIIRNSNA